MESYSDSRVGQQVVQVERTLNTMDYPTIPQTETYFQQVQSKIADYIFELTGGLRAKL